jgi:hypothetical protein
MGCMAMVMLLMGWLEIVMLLGDKSPGVVGNGPVTHMARLARYIGWLAMVLLLGVRTSDG